MIESPYSWALEASGTRAEHTLYNAPRSNGESPFACNGKDHGVERSLTSRLCTFHFASMQCMAAPLESTHLKRDAFEWPAATMFE